MTRSFWIVGLSITVLMFTGLAIICIAALITRRHLSATGWTMFLLSMSSVYFMFGRLRAAIRFGDPTKGMDL